MFKGLKIEVYDKESVRVISLIKMILDLPNLSLKLHQDEDGGYVKVSVMEHPNFIKVVKEIPSWYRIACRKNFY